MPVDRSGIVWYKQRGIEHRQPFHCPFLVFCFVILALRQQGRVFRAQDPKEDPNGGVLFAGNAGKIPKGIPVGISGGSSAGSAASRP